MSWSLRHSERMSLSCRGRSCRSSSTVRYARLLVLVLGLFSVAAPARAQDPLSRHGSWKRRRRRPRYPSPPVRWLPSRRRRHRDAAGPFEGWSRLTRRHQHPSRSNTRPQSPVHRNRQGLQGLPTAQIHLGDPGNRRRRRAPWSTPPTTTERELTGSDTAGKFFAAGKCIGSAHAQAGAAIGSRQSGATAWRIPMANGPTRSLIWASTRAARALRLADPDAGDQGHGAARSTDRRVLRVSVRACVRGVRHRLGAGAPPSATAAPGRPSRWPGYVAISRLADNRHFLSDVVFGSALGIASGWTVVGRHGRSNYALMTGAGPGRPHGQRHPQAEDTGNELAGGTSRGRGLCGLRGLCVPTSVAPIRGYVAEDFS